MKLLLAFILGVILLSAWEVRGGPRWRTPVVLISCALVGLAFLSQRAL